jgi:hypothetical protein
VDRRKNPRLPYRSTNDNRRRLDVMHIQRLPEPAIEAGVKLLHKYLRCRKTKVANLCHCRIGIVSDGND